MKDMNANIGGNKNKIMEINTSKALNSSQFYNSAKEKKQIIWHHTAGTTADGAIGWWNQTPEVVGTAFVIDRDGTIYQIFDPKLWAYHLGVRAKDGGDVNDLDEKQSIGIEIVAAGPLHQDETGKFFHYPLWPNKSAKNKVNQDEVWDMGEEGWKGNRFYHAYNDKQIEALFGLTKKLMTDFKIPVQADIGKMYEFSTEVVKNKTPGIWSHSTVRKDKSDIVPHPSFIEKIKKAFKPTK